MNTMVPKCRLLLLLAAVTAAAMLFGAGSSRTRYPKPDYVPLVQVIDYFDYAYQFNCTTGKLKVGKEEDWVIFMVGTHEVYHQDKLELLGKKVKFHQGQILVPSDGVDLIIRYLHKRRLEWVYREGSFSVADGREGRSRPQRPQSRERLYKNSDSDYQIHTIIIDPGHGGKDPGGIGIDGVMEKEVVLGVSKEIKNELARLYRNKEIIMTREDDRFVSLGERSQIANGVPPEKNPVLVSIHANVGLNEQAKGYETYFLSLEPFGEQARDVASMENSVLAFEIENYNQHLREIINRIVDIEYRRESMQMAGYIQEQLNVSIGKYTENRGVKSAFFYVLKEVKMPSVLVEIGFVTNKKETRNLMREDYQYKIARGIALGIDDFVDTFNRTRAFTR